MGAAAYNRGSRVITRQFDAEASPAGGAYRAGYAAARQDAAQEIALLQKRLRRAEIALNVASAEKSAVRVRLNGVLTAVSEWHASIVEKHGPSLAAFVSGVAIERAQREAGAGKRAADTDGEP